MRTSWKRRRRWLILECRRRLLILETPTALLAANDLRPERQGLFGLLSVGFIAAMLVTMIGFLAQTLLGFQRRMVELGVLRAIGMSTRQLAGLLIGDVVLKVDGQPTAGPADLLPFVDEDRVGATLSFRVLRAGATRDVRVTVGQRDGQAA